MTHAVVISSECLPSPPRQAQAVGWSPQHSINLGTSMIRATETLQGLAKGHRQVPRGSLLVSHFLTHTPGDGEDTGHRARSEDQGDRESVGVNSEKGDTHTLTEAEPRI